MESEKTEVQQDVERVRRGALVGQGVALQIRDKGAPCPGTQRSGGSTARLANWLVNVQTRLFSQIPHQAPF